MRRRWVYWAPLAFFGFFFFIALGGAIVLLLWNWLLPPLFGVPAIGFWQALGLLALCRILFGRWGGHGGYRSRYRRRMAERCGSMTPEERERFRQRVRERWGFSPPADESERQGSGSGIPEQ